MTNPESGLLRALMNVPSAKSFLSIMNALPEQDKYDCVVIADASLNHQGHKKSATIATVILPDAVHCTGQLHTGIKKPPILETMAVESGLKLARELLGDSAKIHVITDCNDTIAKHLQTSNLGATVDCIRPFRKGRRNTDVSSFPEHEDAHVAVDFLAKTLRQTQHRDTIHSHAERIVWNRESLQELADRPIATRDQIQGFKQKKPDGTQRG